MRETMDTVDIPEVRKALNSLMGEYNIRSIVGICYLHTNSTIEVDVWVTYPDLGRSYVAHTTRSIYRFKPGTDFTKPACIRGLLKRVRNDMVSAYKIGAPKPLATSLDMMSIVTELNNSQDGSFSAKEGPSGEYTLRYTLPVGVPANILDGVLNPIRDCFRNITVRQYP